MKILFSFIEHLEEIRQKYPDGDHNTLHKKKFQRWFHSKVIKQRLIPS